MSLILPDEPPVAAPTRGYDRRVVEQQSRLQLLDQLGQLYRVHAEATAGRGITPRPASEPFDAAATFDRYTYAELLVIQDFLTTDTERIRSGQPVG